MSGRIGEKGGRCMDQEASSREKRGRGRDWRTAWIGGLIKL